jgi:hypothetical protein
MMKYISSLFAVLFLLTVPAMSSALTKDEIIQNIVTGGHIPRATYDSPEYLRTHPLAAQEHRQGLAFLKTLTQEDFFNLAKAYRETKRADGKRYGKELKVDWRGILGATTGSQGNSVTQAIASYEVMLTRTLDLGNPGVTDERSYPKELRGDLKKFNVHVIHLVAAYINLSKRAGVILPAFGAAMPANQNVPNVNALILSVRQNLRGQVAEEDQGIIIEQPVVLVQPQGNAIPANLVPAGEQVYFDEKLAAGWANTYDNVLKKFIYFSPEGPTYMYDPLAGGQVEIAYNV